MIGDNSNLMPIGSRMISRPEGYGIFLYSMNKETGLKTMAEGGLNGEDPSQVFGQAVFDIINYKEPFPDVEIQKDLYPSELISQIEYNKKLNWNLLRSGKKIPEPSNKNILILFAGPSLEETAKILKNHRSKFTIITVGKAQKYLPGDYYIGLDPNPQHLNNIPNDNPKTIAILADIVYPDIITKISWRKRCFFTTQEKRRKLPYLWPGENVGYAAIQIAINYLGGKRIILASAEHQHPDPDNLTYYFHGKYIEAVGFWAHNHNIEVINTTPSGSIINGVKHIKLQSLIEEEL